MAEEVIHDTSGLPDSVQNMFGSDSGSSDVDGGSTDTPVSESERAGNEGGTQQASGNQPKDYDAVVRQRDAIIREKQALANERRSLVQHIERLTQMWNQNANPNAAQNATPALKEVAPAPDPKIDPIGYLEHQRKTEIESVRGEIQQLQTAFRQKSEEINNREASNRIYNQVIQDEATFRQAKPDYDNAVNHLDSEIRKYFANQGATEDQVETGLRMFKEDVFKKAVSLGLPVAETFYHHALHFGFSAGKPSQAANGARPNPRIAAAKNGAEAGSLSSAGRGSTSANAGGGNVTVEQFMQMPLGDPVKMLISSDKGLFRQLFEQGEVRVA